MLKVFFVCSSMSLVLASCASSTMEYARPSPASVNNAVSTQESFDVLWDRLVRNLSSDFFVINNVEKASRIINVSFSTKNPEKYADCGRSFRKFINARGENVYSYDVAESSVYTFVNPANNIAFNAYRDTKLEGRANIYVASDKSGTTTNVNIKYVLTIDVKFSNLAGAPAGSQSSTIDFSTKEPFEGKRGSNGADPISCRSKGVLESKILDYAR